MPQLELGVYGSRDLMNLQVIELATGAPLMHWKLANTIEDASTGDTTYARGAGVRQIAYSNETEKTLTVTGQIFSLQQLALMYGRSIVEGAKDIYRSEVLVVAADGTITLSRTPINDDVAVLPYVNGAIKRLPQTVESVTGATVTLDTTGDSAVAPGDEVEVYYQYNVSRAFTLRLPAIAKSPYVKLIGDTLWADKNSGQLVPVQQVYYRARMDQGATMSFSAEGDPADFVMTFQILPVTIKGEEVLSDIIVYDDPSADNQYVDIVYDGTETVNDPTPPVTPPTTP